MTAGVELANAALGHLGEDAIADPDQPGTGIAPRVLGRLPRVRDKVLQAYWWNCAEAEAALGMTDDPQPWSKMTHSATLPSGAPNGALPWCLHVRAAAADDWKVMGRRLHAKAAGPLAILYTRRVEDPAEMDPLLFELIGLELAAAMLNGLGTAESRRRYPMLLRLLDDARGEARRVDAAEGGRVKLAQGQVPTWSRYRPAPWP